MTREKKETSVLRSFILTDRMHRRLFENKMNGIGIHRSQHRVLMYLFRHLPNAPSQKELAEHFDISPAAIAVTLKKLETAGYITRTALESDNRVNTVVPTEKAYAIAEKTREYSEELENVVFADFSDAELDAFEKSLEKIQQAMRRYEERAAQAKGESQP